jgi:hypothetical protein
MLGGLKKAAMKRAMKFMQSETGMKLMQNERVMNAAMKAFALRGKLQSSLESASSRLASTFGFATKEEMGKLRAIIRDLEDSLERMQSEQERKRPHLVDSAEAAGD